MVRARRAPGVVAGDPIPAGTAWLLLGRFRGLGGQLITQASLSSITYTVTDLTNGVTLGSGTFTISTVVYNQLIQGDPDWEADWAGQPGGDGAYGYNFRATVPASLFATSTIAATTSPLNTDEGKLVQVDVVFTPVSGQPFRQSFQKRVVSVYG